VRMFLLWNNYSVSADVAEALLLHANRRGAHVDLPDGATVITGTVSGTHASSLAAGDGVTFTDTLTGALTGDAVAFSPTSDPHDNLSLAWVRVSAADTIKWRIHNVHAADGVTPGAITWNARIVRG